MKHHLLGALILAPALLFATGASGKVCQEINGGTCKDHGKCDDSDTSKVCTDYLTRSGYECRCMKPAGRVLLPLQNPVTRVPVHPAVQPTHPSTSTY